MLCETWWEVLCNPVGGCFGPTSGTKRALCCMVSAKTRQCYLRPASISCLPLRPPWPLESPRLVLLFPPTALSNQALPTIFNIFFHKAWSQENVIPQKPWVCIQIFPSPSIIRGVPFFIRTIAIFFVFCCTRTLWFSPILGYNNDSDLQNNMSTLLLSPSGDLGIGLIWDNHPIQSNPIRHFGPSVEIFFKLN